MKWCNAWGEASRIAFTGPPIGSRLDVLGSRIDTLQRVMIWPLIVLLATTVFGLLYRVIITAPG